MKLVLIALCACLIAPGLKADEASKRAKIEEFLTASHVEQLIEQQQQQVRALMHQTLLKAAPSMENDPKLAKVEQAITDEATAGMSYQTLKPDFIRIYADTYTEEELDGLVKFYESPAGQAFVNKMPIVMTKTMELVQQRMQTMIPKMQERMKELVGPDSKPATAPQQ